MKETNIVKKKLCGKCRHFERHRSLEKGNCEAYIALPFWMLIGVNTVVNAVDGADCNLYMDLPNGDGDHADNGNQRKAKEESGH